MENVVSDLKEIVEYIQNSKEYQMCIKLKKQMADNTFICERVNQIKRLQKQFVQSGYDSKIKKELDVLVSELETIPVYVIYTENLEVVNQKIDYVRDSLNDYFQLLFEKDTNF